MHGRLKVRSTAEQAEAKRLEREKKLKVYQKVTSQVNSKRKNEELDEEALSLTGQLLIVNPDFYTLWNFRREILQHFKKERETTQLQELCTKELSFLESCLPVNPKSYGIWHHRGWIMLFMPQPDWKRELKLCNVYLRHDERNFHCWDYRRFVVEHAQVSALEEFEFTSNKIKENFSNYSSWHYRSKLLPKIHPYASGDSERIEETALLKEFELVQNAFFTDPNDQSAWFYHRWLLGRAKDDLSILLAYLRRTCGGVSVSLLFNQRVKPENVLSVVLKINGSEKKTQWFNPHKNSQPSSIWTNIDLETKKNTEEINLLIACEELNASANIRLEGDKQETWHNFSDQLHYVFRSELTAVHTSFLQTELESCQLLLEEEPDNKWTILTIVLLMRAINPMKYSLEVEDYLKRLRVVDPYRYEYYNDLGQPFEFAPLYFSKCPPVSGYFKYLYFKIQYRVRALGNSGLTQLDLYQYFALTCVVLVLDISIIDSKYKLENTIERHFMKFKNDKNLSSLFHMEQLLLMTEVNLSNNKLDRLDDCNMLQCAKEITVDNNKLVTIVKYGTLNLPHLEKLSLKDNNITTVSSLNALQGCRNLKELDFDSNPVTTLPNWKEEIRSILPRLKKLNGEQLIPE